jgi:hypothetical protein
MIKPYPQNSRVNCNPSDKLNRNLIVNRDSELNRNLIVNRDSELNRNLIVNRDSDNKFLIIKPIDSYKPILNKQNKENLSLLFNYKYEKDKKNDNNNKVVYVNFLNTDIKYSLPNTREPDSKHRHRSNTNKTKTKQKLVKEIIIDNSINSKIQSLCIKYRKDLFPYAGYNEIIELGYPSNPDWEQIDDNNVATKIVTIGILSLDGLKVIIDNNIEDAMYKRSIGKKQKIKLCTTLKQNITSIIKNTIKRNIENTTYEFKNKVSLSDLANGIKLIGSFTELHKVNKYQHKYFESRQIFPPMVSYLLGLCGFLDNILTIPQYNKIDTEFEEFTFDINPEIEEKELSNLTEIERLVWYLSNFDILKKKFNSINQYSIIDEEQEEINNLINRKLNNTNSDYNNDSVMFGYQPNIIDEYSDNESLSFKETNNITLKQSSIIDNESSIIDNESSIIDNESSMIDDIDNNENIQYNNNIIDDKYIENRDNKYIENIDNKYIENRDNKENIETFVFGNINNYLHVKENTKKNKKSKKRL